MVTYRSKIGLELIVPLCVIFGGVITAMIFDKVWISILFLMPVAAFVTHMLLTTYYVVDGQMLAIKCGFLVNLKVDINTINKIRETNNPLSSPAASLDRLEVSYGKFDDVMISPKNKSAFIQQLTEINPGIEVVYKQKNKAGAIHQA